MKDIVQDIMKRHDVVTSLNPPDLSFIKRKGLGVKTNRVWLGQELSPKQVISLPCLDQCMFKVHLCDNTNMSMCVYSILLCHDY